MKTIISLLIVLVCSFCSCTSRQVVYVDSSYSGTLSDGSSEHPFRNFESGYKQIAKIKEKSPGTKIKLIFKEGNYTFNRGYLLDEKFSNLTFSAAAHETVTFSGGIELPIQTEIMPDGRTHKLNLSPIKDLEFVHIHNTGFSRPFLNSWVELFVNGKPMHLSRWPNKGMIPLGKIIAPGSNPRQGDFSNKSGTFVYDSLRISTWKARDDMWISGYFKYGYADDALRIAQIDRRKKEITTDGPTFYSFASGSPWQRFYAFNIKEELDEEGEFYLDKKEKTLSFIPYGKSISSIHLSQLNEVMFDIYKAKNITFENIIFEYSRAALISMVKTEQVHLKGCTFRNCGSLAIIVGMGVEPFKEFVHEGTGKPTRGLVGSLSQHLYANNAFYRQGGKNNTIENCTFYNLGAGAISLGGGDRLTLEPGNNTVKECVFYDNNRIEKSYRPHIDLTGVGNKIIGCELYNSPSMAILMHGNNHLIKGNYIHDVCLEVEDQGAFYYGRNPSECGTILRRNLFANIPNIYSTCAVYNDDGAGGLIVDQNIFYNAGRYGVLLGGGSDNQYTNNLFANMQYGLHVDNRLQNWSKSLIKKEGLFEKRLKEVNYNKAPYASAYPYLENYLPNDSLPKRNLVSGNVFVGINQLSDNKQYLECKDNQFISQKIELKEFSLEALKSFLSKHEETQIFTDIIPPKLNINW